MRAVSSSTESSVRSRRVMVRGVLLLGKILVEDTHIPAPFCKSASSSGYCGALGSSEALSGVSSGAGAVGMVEKLSFSAVVSAARCLERKIE